MIVLFFAFGNCVFAENRTAADMLRIAKGKLSVAMAKGNGTARQMRIIATTSSLNISQSEAGANDYIYVYGYDGGGFVLVSGDDAFVPVLAYSENASFDAANLPDNVRNWLAGYVNEMKAYKDGKIKIVHNVAVKQTDSSLPASVPPFMTATWGQGDPYNAKCPTVTDGTKDYSTVTGCVATAMAQVMYYYKYPTTGVGSNTYKYNLNLNSTGSREVNVTADFTTGNYDWANMIDSYAASGVTQAQKDAVATLMFHAGASVFMKYAPNSSSSSDVSALFAMRDNFGFDDGIRYYSRDYMTDDEWIAILKTESAAGRPVIYGGQGTGGHEFIVNGYNSSNQFYFNWGWEGYCNGYYSVSSLQPADNGTLEGDNFSYNNTMIAGLQKPSSATTVEKPVIRLITDDNNFIKTDDATIKPGDVASNTASFCNFSTQAFTGYLGIIITDENDNVKYSGSFSNFGKQTFAAGLQKNGGMMYYPQINGLEFNYPTLSDGKYKLYYAYRRDGETDWQKMEADRSKTYFYYLTYKSGAITRSITGFAENKTLNVTVKDATRLYGEDNPTFEYTYPDLAAGTTVTWTTAPTVATTATKTSDVGTYDITLTGGVAEGYTSINATKGTLTINKANQTITWNQELTELKEGGTTVLNATSSSGLQVSYSSSNTTLATIITSGSQSTLNFVKAGQVDVTASQSGNNNYNAASDVKKTLIIIPTSVESVGHDAMTVHTADGVLTVSGIPANSMVRVYSADGRQLYSGTDTTIRLAPGIYLLRAGSATKRVVVK